MTFVSIFGQKSHLVMVPLFISPKMEMQNRDALYSVHFMIRFSQKKRRNRGHDGQWGRMFRI